MAIYAPATWDPISGDLGHYRAGPFRIVHHTTEGNTYAAARAAFAANKSDPHFTVDGGTVYQHIDTDRVARALRHPAGTVETNRLSAVQIEVVAFAALPKDGVALATVAALCRWLEGLYQIPQSWPNGHPLEAVNGHDPGGHNRDVVNWTTQSGHYGHCHVPGNIHWDPAYSAAEVAVVTPLG
jgi:hypothetical protein